jgi:rRNA-processing protein FCF1
MLREDDLINKYRGRGILVDSNLLLLLLIGSHDLSLISRFKRTSGYTAEDYKLLADFVQMFASIATTPHVLTEVSNLANPLGSPIKEQWFGHFRRTLQLFEEHPLEAQELSARNEFLVFGLTDTALCTLCEDVLLITEDYRLSGYLRSKNLPVINFCDIRAVQKLIV